MRMTRFWPLGLMIILLIAGLVYLKQETTVFGPAISRSSTLLHDQIQSYYPLELTQRITYSYPNRPFDTDLTIEGIGWQNGRAFLLMAAQVNHPSHTYSHMSKYFSPRVTYQGKTVLFSKMLWAEGAGSSYDGSIYRYAVAVEDPAFLPPDTLPAAIQVSHAVYPLPAQLPNVYRLPTLPLLRVKTGSVEKLVSSGELIYQVKALQVNDRQRELTITVNSELDDEETSRFLLQDDKNRIYTFHSGSLPTYYYSGENEVTLKIVEPLPGDISHLKLIIFQSEFQQLALYNILSQASIEIF